MSLFNMELSYPPTVNKYWLYTKTGKRVLTPRAREYKKTIAWQVNLCDKDQFKKRTIDVQVIALIELYPPDNRVRDTDNTQKAVFDALQYAQVIKNDKLIVEHHVKLFPKKKGEKCNYIYVALLDASACFIWDRVVMSPGY